MKKVETTLSLELYEDGSRSFLGEAPIDYGVSQALERLLYESPRKHKIVVKKIIKEIERVVKNSVPLF